MSDRNDIKIQLQIFDNNKLGSAIDWNSKNSRRTMFLDLLNYLDNQISKRIFPLKR